MAIFGYVRVSNEALTNENQKHAILEHCNYKKLGHVTFEDEIISSRVKLKKRKLNDLLEKCQRGDTIVVYSLDRLCRNGVIELNMILSTLREKGVYLHAIKENMILDENDLDSRNEIFLTVMAICARIEREKISERTKTALAHRKSEGVKLGRPAGISPPIEIIQKIYELALYRLSYRKIAGLLSMHPKTIQKYILHYATDERFQDRFSYYRKKKKN